MLRVRWDKSLYIPSQSSTPTSPLHRTPNTMKLFTVTTLISSAAALGINCRGSGFCSINNGASLQVVHDQIGNLVASGGADRRFSDGRKYS